jgi:hypothetical protein
MGRSRSRRQGLRHHRPLLPLDTHLFQHDFHHLARVRRFQKEVAKIVHCGLSQDSLEALVPCEPTTAPASFGGN